MRIQAINISSYSDIKASLEFYMGKNSPKRKQFIMQNLISEPELV